MSYAVEVTYDRDLYGAYSRHETREEPEVAAQLFESEANTPRAELPDLIEALADGQRLERFDEETGKRVVAHELVEAVV